MPDKLLAVRQRFILLYPAIIVLAFAAHFAAAQHPTSVAAVVLTVVFLGPIAVLAARISALSTTVFAATTAQFVAHYTLQIFGPARVADFLSTPSSAGHHVHSYHALATHSGAHSWVASDVGQLISAQAHHLDGTGTLDSALTHAHSASAHSVVMFTMHLVAASLLAGLIHKVDDFLESTLKAVKTLFRAPEVMVLGQPRIRVSAQRPILVRASASFFTHVPRRGPPTTVSA